jgi:hypothetical protein
MASGLDSQNTVSQIRENEFKHKLKLQFAGENKEL